MKEEDLSSITLKGRSIPDLPYSELFKVCEAVIGDWRRLKHDYPIASVFLGSILPYGWMKAIELTRDISLTGFLMFFLLLSVLMFFTVLWGMSSFSAYKNAFFKIDIAQVWWRIEEMHPDVIEEYSCWDTPFFRPKTAVVDLMPVWFFPMSFVVILFFLNLEDQFTSFTFLSFLGSFVCFNMVVFMLHWIVLRKCEKKGYDRAGFC